MDKLTKEEIKKIQKTLPNILDRNPKLSSIGRFSVKPELAYHNLINDWIPNQPDHYALMNIFILVGFDVLTFVRIISFKEDWGGGVLGIINENEE